MAVEAAPFKACINPGSAAFLAPENMPDAIRAFCQKSGQEIPETKGEIIRTVLESLALEYRLAAETIDQLTGKYHRVIHIIGGG